MKKSLFQNIPSANFEVTETETREVQAVVRQNISGWFNMSIDAARQIMLGAHHMENASAKVVAILGEHIYSAASGHMMLTRDQVQAMRQLLEARMAHCEKQRDERDENFNPDTYIMQKMLLLDLREWLIGEVVS